MGVPWCPPRRKLAVSAVSVSRRKGWTSRNLATTPATYAHPSKEAGAVGRGASASRPLGVPRVGPAASSRAPPYCAEPATSRTGEREQDAARASVSSSTAAARVPAISCATHPLQKSLPDYRSHTGPITGVCSEPSARSKMRLNVVYTRSQRRVQTLLASSMQSNTCRATSRPVARIRTPGGEGLAPRASLDARGAWIDG